MPQSGPLSRSQKAPKERRELGYNEPLGHMSQVSSQTSRDSVSSFTRPFCFQCLFPSFFESLVSIFSFLAAPSLPNPIFSSLTRSLPTMKHLSKAALVSFSLLRSTQAAPVGIESLSGGSLLGSAFGVPGDQSFDYVIVGGGTAGLALANRLSELPYSVAVIEAGGFYEVNNGNVSQIPLDVPIGTDKNTQNYNPLVDWGFVTTPQEVRNGHIHGSFWLKTA